MSPEERAARIADARTLLDMLAADESLPLPQEMKTLCFYFHADGTAEETLRQFTALEAAIPPEFDDGQPDGPNWVTYGVMAGGVKVKLYGWARHIAEEVTTVKPVKEWHRFLPVQDEAPESGEGE